jgi:hypothetical protein
VRIKVPNNATCGNVPIPANEYWVSLNSDAGEIALSAGGKDIRIKATRRRANVNAKTTSVQFYSGGGKVWSLIIVVPKGGEWLALIEYV